METKKTSALIKTSIVGASILLLSSPLLFNGKDKKPSGNLESLASTNLTSKLSTDSTNSVSTQETFVPLELNYNPGRGIAKSFKSRYFQNNILFNEELREKDRIFVSEEIIPAFSSFLDRHNLPYKRISDIEGIDHLRVYDQGEGIRVSTFRANNLVASISGNGKTQKIIYFQDSDQDIENLIQKETPATQQQLMYFTNTHPNILIGKEENIEAQIRDFLVNEGYNINTMTNQGLIQRTLFGINLPFYEMTYIPTQYFAGRLNPNSAIPGSTSTRISGINGLVCGFTHMPEKKSNDTDIKLPKFPPVHQILR